MTAEFNEQLKKFKGSLEKRKTHPLMPKLHQATQYAILHDELSTKYSGFGLVYHQFMASCYFSEVARINRKINKDVMR